MSVTNILGRVRQNPRGTWSNSATYTYLDTVNDPVTGSAYMALGDVPAGTALTNTAYWMLLVHGFPVQDVTTAVESWLDEHITEGIAVDNTLAIGGAAADAKVTGYVRDDVSSLHNVTDVTGEVTNGYYLNPDGATYSNADYQVTDYIPVKLGDIILYDGVYGTLANGNPTNIPVMLYNPNKTVSKVLHAPTQVGANRWRTHAVIPIDANGYIKAESAYNNSASAGYPKCPVTVRKIASPYKEIVSTDMEDGLVYTQTGSLGTNNNYLRKTNFPVFPGQKLYFTGSIGGGAVYHNATGVAGYDANGNFVTSVFDNDVDYSDGSIHSYNAREITIPTGVYLISFCARKDSALILYQYTDDNQKNIREFVEDYYYGQENSATIFDSEVKTSIEAVQTVLASSGVPMLTMAVFTDLHHDPKYANDPTVDMMANIKEIYDRIHFDALMNLGDAIDGQFQTQYEAEGCISDVVTAMYNITDRSHNLEGNHDNNVQSTWNDRGGEPASEKLTPLEVYEALYKGSEAEVHNPNHLSDYYVDYPKYGIRVICVGIDYTTYSGYTKTWLEDVALDTDLKVLVYSHCATKAKWGYNNDINNGSYIEDPLNDFVENGGTVIALIHGHTHGDMIETDDDISFTEVAIGCAKFETLSGGTTGITYQPRNASDYTKILFDIVCVDQTNDTVHFIRCGAGSDRYITY